VGSRRFGGVKGLEHCRRTGSCTLAGRRTNSRSCLVGTTGPRCLHLLRATTPSSTWGVNLKTGASCGACHSRRDSLASGQESEFAVERADLGTFIWRLS